MFGTIFSFELKRWFRSWVFYLYLAIFFGLSFFMMAAALGYFESNTVTVTSQTYMNAPISIYMLVDGLNQILYFLFPSIIGVAIYRDYKYETHHILYAYPFSKMSYLLGKFFSGFLITLIISLFIGLGLYIATVLPWANENLIGPNLFWNYAQAYLLGIIPNMLFMGIIVFAVTTLSRSIYVGFIAVIVVLVLQGVVSGLASNLDNKVIAALIDPTGAQAIFYYTDYWTIDEYNTQNLPFEKWFIYNRAIWLGISLLFLGLLAFVFRFSQQAVSFSFWKKKKAERLVKNNFAGLNRIRLPEVKYDFSLRTQWANIWNFMKMDFSYLVRSKVFLILVGVGILLMILLSTVAMNMMGTTVYPVTRLMHDLPGSSFRLMIIVITFLGAGLLVHRANLTKMDPLTDSTPVRNWVMFISKTGALISVQAVLLLVIMVGGVIIQSFDGYFHFEIGLYLTYLLGFDWIEFIIWAGLAIAVQTFFKNYIVGFLVLLLFFLFGGQLSKLGVEQDIFFFGKLPSARYSDMAGFGSGVVRYFIYAFYWLLFIGFLSGLTLLFWRRGVSDTLKNRLYKARGRSRPVIIIPVIVCLAGFIGLGSYLYYDNVVKHTYYSQKELEIQQADYEKKYKQYEHLDQPRIVDIQVAMDIYPSARNFEARGTYLLKNKTDRVVDSLLVSFARDYHNEIDMEGAQLLSEDTVFGLRFYKLDPALDPGEEIQLSFVTRNKPNTVLRNNSPVLGNGTFINNTIFPGLGYNAARELVDNEVRNKYNLPPKERMAAQTDTVALQNTYISNDADWVRFETTVSTAEDQIAVAPGYLQKEWVENGRRYFHYKMDEKMMNFYAFNSARYEVKKDKWKDINIEIYYHKGHEFNLDRMVKGVQKGLDYYTQNYSPYQHRQVRILEFPTNMGTFAQSFANTIPFSEGIGFIAKVDDEDPNGVDYPFSVTAHEVAHQWWAHQVIGADVQGATMLSESLAEYSSLKVLEHEHGKTQMRAFLRDALDRYLSARSGERKKEKPLMYNENQPYIHYNKGSVVFYALSDYLGEQKFNRILRDYIQAVGFQEPPYTTAAELVADIRQATPDSLQYLIKDMFATITLYDNYIDQATAQKLPDGRYEVEISSIVSKYRAGEKGERTYSDNGRDSLVAFNDKKREIKSLPLQDYVEVGIFGLKDKKNVKADKEPEEKVLYLKKVKVTDIRNEWKIIVDEKPAEVGIDPYNKLIDTRSYDNRRAVEIKKTE